MSGGADRWIRLTTIGCVALPAMIAAGRVIAAWPSSALIGAFTGRRRARHRYDLGFHVPCMSATWLGGACCWTLPLVKGAGVWSLRGRCLLGELGDAPVGEADVGACGL